MGRKRKDGNPHGLEPRVEWHHAQYRYRHRDGRNESLGPDLSKANARARIYNDPEQRYGTIGYFLDLYIAEARSGRLFRPLAPRTVDDYEVQAPYLKAVFDRLGPEDLAADPSLVADYRDHRTAKTRANRELSLLSAMYSWLIEKGHCPGLTVNPATLVRRNPEKPKERYVEDAEYDAVYAIAQRSVCMAMELVKLTLQRPADVLKGTPGDVREKTVSGGRVKVLSVRQNKTARPVDIAVTPELAEALAMLSGAPVARFSRHLVHDLRGEPYTVGGIGAMLRRYCKTAKVKSFGLMDLRAKGATDMYQRGVPLERIQRLMGHKSVKTTEIYIKRLMGTIQTATPNVA